MENNEHLIPIPGRLHSVATDGHVAGADEIYDDAKGKSQADVNSEVFEALGEGGSVDTKIENAINALDATVSQIAEQNNGGLNLQVTETNGKITSVSGSINPNTYDEYGAASEEATRAKNAETELDSRVTTNEGNIEALQEAYRAITQGQVLPKTSEEWAAMTSWEEGVVYRVQGTTSYADYMYNGTTTIKMAEYNNAIDTEPTAESDNLVKSSGVFNNIGAFDISELNATENPHTLAMYEDLVSALNALPTSYRKGGISVKFVQSSDNKYVQYRLMTDNWSIVPSDWQKVENINQYLLDKDAILFDFKDVESVGNIENSKNAQTSNNKVRIVTDAASTYNLLTYGINEEKFFKCKCSSYNNPDYGVGVYFVDSDNNILYKWYAETYGTYIVTLSVPDGATKIYVNGIDGLVPECISGTLSNVPKYIAKIAQEKQERENADNGILEATEREVLRRKNADNGILEAIEPVLKAEHVKGESLGTVQNGKNMQIQSSGYVFTVDAPSTYNVLTYDINDETLLLCKYSATSDTLYGVGVVFVDSSNKAISRQNEDVAGTYSREISVPYGAIKVFINGTEGLVPECNLINIQREFSFEYFDYISPKISLSLFENIGVIGDSYASGELYYNGDYHDKYNISWGQQIARKFGIQCINFSSGGLTTRTWLTATKGLPKLLNDPAQDLYLLVLGINDYYSLGSNYLGTIEDITSHESYEDYGDTFYGNYGRIIEQTVQHAPNAKLVMFGLAATAETAITFDTAIREIAAHYNIPYINQKDDNFYLETVYTNMSGGHPTAIGYARMAIAFERLLSKCILDNIQYFGNYKMND